MIERRKLLTYIIIFLWLAFGIFSIIEKGNITGLPTYFLSLTGFVGSYLFGESYRKSNKKYSVFKDVRKCSKREFLIYIVILIWVICGTVGILYDASMSELGAYFGSLTPFVASYMMSDTFKPSEEENHQPSETQSSKTLRANKMPPNTES